MDMLEMETPFLTPSDIRNITFSTKLFGYDKEEVDEVMDRIYHDYQLLYRQNKELRERIAALQRELDRLRELEDNIKESIVLARETAKKLIRSAEEEANQTYRKKLLELEDKQRQLNALIIAIRSQIISLIQLRDHLVDEISTSLDNFKNRLNILKSKWDNWELEIEEKFKAAIPDISKPLTLPSDTLSPNVKLKSLPKVKRRGASRRDGDLEVLRCHSKA